MCEGFATAGHTVIGCSRSAHSVAELQKRYGAPHRFSAVDVGDAAAVATWATEAHAQYGPPDLIINNAGLINSNANLWQVSSHEFEQVCRVNLGGTHAAIRAFLPEMIKNGAGGIINFSSTWGHSTAPQVAPYCATKWGIEGLTQALAQELPSGFFAVALNPGVVNTDMLKSCFGGAASGYVSPAAWAETAVPFILGLGPKHNGQSLRVPG